jgi:aminoglycoside 6-adenylyltransferase
MRTEQEIYDLILHVAKADERIRTVLLCGSRANPNAPKDEYQDYDVAYYVRDITPFYNRPEWIAEKFGEPLIMQMPEIMRGAANDGNFIYLVIFPDGIRIDLSFVKDKYRDDDGLAVVLLDKDKGRGMVPVLPPPSDKNWHIKPPTQLDYYSSCNEFWWCLNNVAKEITREELSYVMWMRDDVVRGELHHMMDWFIGSQRGYKLTVGKHGKYYSKLLPPDLYERYRQTYSGSDYGDIWRSVDVLCDLFHELALAVAKANGFIYRQQEEDGMRRYLSMIREMR